MLQAALVAVTLVTGSPNGALDEARRALYNQEYSRADELVLRARTNDPNDPSTFEFRTALFIFRLTDYMERRKVDMSGAMRTCAECAQWKTQCESELKTGLSLAEKLLSADGRDPDLRYVHAKLLLNNAWLEHTGSMWKGRENLKRGREEMEALLRDEPRHVRALTTLGYMEFRLGSRNSFIQKLAGRGEKSKGYAYLALALALGSEGSSERTDAEFALWDMYDRDKRIPEAVETALRLKVRFPQNTALAKFVEENQKLPR